MKAHTDALVALTQQIPALATKTFVAIAKFPTGTEESKKYPYVVYFPAAGTDSAERMTGPAVTQHPRWTRHTVGQSYAQVADTEADIHAKLVPNGRGVVLEVAGQVCGPMWDESPIPIQVDNDVTPPLVYAVSECGFDSDPA